MFARKICAAVFVIEIKIISFVLGLRLLVLWKCECSRIWCGEKVSYMFEYFYLTIYQRCFVLVNIGVEFNVIIIDVADRAGLAMRTRIKIKILLYSEYISRFLEMVENMLISVDLVVCRVNIFITRSISQSFILGIFYLYSVCV